MKTFAKLYTLSILLTLLIAACGSSNNKTYTEAETLAAFEKGACGSCHVIQGVPNAAGVVAPDLSQASTNADAHLKSGS